VCRALGLMEQPQRIEISGNVKPLFRKNGIITPKWGQMNIFGNQNTLYYFLYHFFTVISHKNNGKANILAQINPRTVAII
jgi:hypothetical protein